LQSFLGAHGMKLPIYMDYHATTPVDPRVLDAMLPYFSQVFGNASSRQHSFGRAALEAVEKARHQVAQLVGARDQEIVFTSGATESNNVAILGVAEACRKRGNHIITCETEHRSVLDPCLYLEKNGFRVTRLPVRNDGILDIDQLASAICSHTILISVMVANNEIGVLQPMEAICSVAQGRDVLVHADAAQACGKVPIDMQSLPVHLLSLSAHKIYGPKGVGALYARKRCARLRIAPRVHGGGHERGLRSGTLNVPGIVGFGAACQIAQEEMDAESDRLSRLRDLLSRLLHEQIAEIVVNGSMERRLPNNLNVSFRCVEGESLLMSLRDIAVSSASACTTAATEPSHVLKALGLSPELAHTSIRFGLGRWNTEEEVIYVAQRTAEEVRRLRSLSATWAEQTSLQKKKAP
jgi:cysteine desulfurase